MRADEISLVCVSSGSTGVPKLCASSEAAQLANGRGIAERFGITDVAFEECSGSLAGLAIQGPMAARALLAMGFDDIEQMAPFEARHYAMSDGEALISRTGFTADLGYECWVAPEQIDELTRLIERARSQLSIAIPGYGLAAVQACRLEGGFIVAGWDCATELDPQPGLERSPYELGMGWQVKLDDRDFVGREALLQQKENGCKHLFRYFQADVKRPPDDGARITLKDSDEAIGMVTSSAYSPGLKKVIGNATVQADAAELSEACVAIDGQRVAVRLDAKTHVDFERRTRTPAPS